MSGGREGGGCGATGRRVQPSSQMARLLHCPVSSRQAGQQGRAFARGGCTASRSTAAFRQRIRRACAVDLKRAPAATAPCRLRRTSKRCEQGDRGAAQGEQRSTTQCTSQLARAWGSGKGPERRSRAAAAASTGGVAEPAGVGWLNCSKMCKVITSKKHQQAALDLASLLYWGQARPHGRRHVSRHSNHTMDTQVPSHRNAGWPSIVHLMPPWVQTAAGDCRAG